MAHVLTASNSEVLRLLGSRAAARLGLERHLAGTGREALQMAQRLRPRVAILDLAMPDLDGYEVCRRIKADPALASCRVMLVVSGILTRTVLDRLGECGCDDVLMMPAITEELFAHLADLLGVPRRRSRRVTVQLLARVEGGTEVRQGLVDNLSLHGLKVKLDGPLAPVESVRVRLTPPGAGRAAVLDARVVWRGDDGSLVGLEFRDLTPDARAQLESMAQWEVVAEDDLLRVYLDGDFNESTDFSALWRRLSGRVDFDAAGVRYINSGGSHRFIAFVRGLERVEDYTFSRCSVGFTTQAGLLSEFIGRGRVLSFMAPYHCDSCDRDEARLLQTAGLVPEGGTFAAPRFRCAKCGASLSFDDIPERYFAFLRAGGGA
ncbi:MAG: PilZ domain-containing protein [Deltaproteobacteria bacterium]|nr:PilZ domain-containing protein [Deltaproteobacteria bacterium]